MEGKAQAAIEYGGSLMHSGDNLPAPAVVDETGRKPDFSGWATKFGIECSDGRTITKDAFAHQDKSKVPFVWQHLHDDPTNVLGHAMLEQRDEGVYAHVFLNESDYAVHAKTIVDHGDVESLSIYANKLKERAKSVLHGTIRELSLVLGGANPGALIDNIQLAHGDDLKTLNDEAIIYSGLEDALEHADNKPAEEGPTIQDVYDKMDDDEKAVVAHMVSQAYDAGKQGEPKDDSKAAAAHSALPPKYDPTKDNEEGLKHMKTTRNVFDRTQSGSGATTEGGTLKHDALEEIRGEVSSAFQRHKSLKHAMEDPAVKEIALKHGVEDIDVLFPDAKQVGEIDVDSRRMEWVSGVINGVHKVPFSRIKSTFFDITAEEARAKGYIKGNFKKEEWVRAAKRTTTPTTVYKKQKLDRDDVIDVTDFDLVVWLKGEMRWMLDEELARAILFGDGREEDDEDKINDPVGAKNGEGIRSVLHDDELYAAHVNIPFDIDSASLGNTVLEAIQDAMVLYKGSGSPTWYTTRQVINKILRQKDGMGRRLWRTREDFATEAGIGRIVDVEVLEESTYNSTLGVIVNLRDYAVGTDRGGNIAMFDDFDIDYNQYKYLIETRCSGALIKIRSALVLMKVAGDADLVVPEAPEFDGEDVLIPTNADVNYKNLDTNATIADGATVAVAPGTTLRVRAVPAAGKYFANDQQDDWEFTNNSGS